ncbi:hypothetical protein ZHAS_00016165 [Anopheles sinensis]|uniref:Uncharacterized protein n=1 Tax=Anopheles sinensis TaxID=74873 RepID=A0A084WCV0_ANOSI|nr:hypothetical protein ZHAS_00016165 [Anopheles sinensis]
MVDDTTGSEPVPHYIISTNIPPAVISRQRQRATTGHTSVSLLYNYIHRVHLATSLTPPKPKTVRVTRGHEERILARPQPPLPVLVLVLLLSRALTRLTWPECFRRHLSHTTLVPDHRPQWAGAELEILHLPERRLKLTVQQQQQLRQTQTGPDYKGRQLSSCGHFCCPLNLCEIEKNLITPDGRGTAGT